MIGDLFRSCNHNDLWSELTGQLEFLVNSWDCCLLKILEFIISIFDILQLASSCHDS